MPPCSSAFAAASPVAFGDTFGSLGLGGGVLGSFGDAVTLTRPALPPRWSANRCPSLSPPPCPSAHVAAATSTLLPLVIFIAHSLGVCMSGRSVIAAVLRVVSRPLCRSAVVTALARPFQRPPSRQLAHAQRTSDGRLCRLRRIGGPLTNVFFSRSGADARRPRGGWLRRRHRLASVGRYFFEFSSPLSRSAARWTLRPAHVRCLRAGHLRRRHRFMSPLRSGGGLVVA